MNDDITPIGWITGESLRRLEAGGNNSKGTVPIHFARSITSKHPVYTFEQLDAERKRCFELGRARGLTASAF